eukprot:6180664-Pleurochrysis_carterae.AAC.5
MQSLARVEGGGLVVLVEKHVQMLGKATFNLVLHHGLLNGSQVDVQVRHQQRTVLIDCAAGRNNHGIALASGDDGRDALLSGLDAHVGLGGHAKLERVRVVEHAGNTWSPCAAPCVRRPAQSRVTLQGSWRICARACRVWGCRRPSEPGGPGSACMSGGPQLQQQVDGLGR